MGGIFNSGNELGVTISCEDVENALQFVDDLLEPGIQKLRYWGEEGVDYEVDENGILYRTEEQRAQANDLKYQRENYCRYDYFPHYVSKSIYSIAQYGNTVYKKIKFA